MLSEAKHLGLWGVTPPQMLRRYAPQHGITDMTGVLTHSLRGRSESQPPGHVLVGQLFE